MGVEFWTTASGAPGATARIAKHAEDEGWDGVGVVDSQNLASDPYVELTAAAVATSRIKLGTAVTNVFTRHPAVTATAAATLQVVSGGRAVLGIGRGDSALAHIGFAPAPVPVFERYVRRLQGYLRGEDVPFDREHDAGGTVAAADTLGLAGTPSTSRLHWLPKDLPKVPVDVAATGPRVIEVAALLADGITFAVGADLGRLQWAIGLVRAARERAGLEGMPHLGAYVPIAVHDDVATARSVLSGAVASYARFSVMHGTVAGPVPEGQRRTLEAIHGSYDMKGHFAHGSPQSQHLDDDVAEAFSIAGPASLCIDRLQELAALGITRVYVMGGSRGGDRALTLSSRDRFVQEVIPAFR